MSMQNVLRRLNAALKESGGQGSQGRFADNVEIYFGDGDGGASPYDVKAYWDGTRFVLLPRAVAEEIRIGDGVNCFDVTMYGNTSALFVSWDVSGSRMKFEDNVALHFGTGTDAGQAAAGDVSFQWNGTDFVLLPSTDDYRLLIGNGTLSMDLVLYGNIATSYVEWDASQDQFALRGAARPLGFNGAPRRYELKWTAGQRGKPGINADIQNAAEAVRMIADPDFEVLGVNATSGSTSFNTAGGITLTTAGTDGDEVILVPHLDASQSAWEQVQWLTEKSVIWEAHVKTGASIASSIIWAGLKLTNTEVTATDNDQVFFRYENDVNSGRWQAIESIGGVDTATNSGVTVATSTEYHLKIVIDSSRIARFYINGVLVRTSSALTTAVALKPYVGIAEDGASGAKTLQVYHQAISRAM